MSTNFTADTDKEKKVVLQSNLIYAMWSTGVARGGANTPFEVRTSFVGYGAEIEIICKGKAYGTIAKITDKIYNNRYNGVVPMPSDIRKNDPIWFEVKLAKQGLKGESNWIPGAPQAVASLMQWDREEVRRGDEVTITVEFDSGVEDGDRAKIIIYEYSEQNYHEKVIGIPTEIKDNKIELLWKYDYFDDTEQIPTEAEKQEYSLHYSHPQLFFVVDVDGERIGEGQESGLMKFVDWASLVLQTEDKQLLTNTTATLTFSDGTTQEVTSDENGVVNLENAPPGTIEISFPEEDGQS